jgi:pimeloyl-ACP methyl ester carboxylesterase
MSLPDLPPLGRTDIDGPIAFREWDGPPDTTFVMVHGLGGSNVNWVRVAPGLSGLGRVLAPDLPGFGSSSRAGRDTGLMSLRESLARFIRERATGRVVVCGNSMGGAIAILHAAVEPDSVAGLVLTGSVFPWVRGAWPHPVVMAGFSAYRVPGLGERLMTARLHQIDPERMVRMGFRFVVADPGSLPEDVIALHVDVARHRADDPEAVAALVEAARSMMRLGRRPQVAHRAMDAVRCPVLVLHGRRDRLVPAAFAEAALAREPQWRGRIFPDLGHAPMLESPGRWLAEVADWHAESVAERPGPA